MRAHPRPLIDVCAAIPDCRQPRGTRHPCTALCALACCAMVCGYRSSSAMAAWGRNDGARLVQALGFTHDTPCAATLHTILRRVHRDECAAHLGGRYVITQNTTEERVAVVSGVTSLRPERGTPERLLELVRGHWQIENTSHGVRDVTCEEDGSQVRCGHIPPVLAALRHTTIGLLRGAGYSNIAAACRRFAAQPDLALTLT